MQNQHLSKPMGLCWKLSGCLGHSWPLFWRFSFLCACCSSTCIKRHNYKLEHVAPWRLLDRFTTLPCFKTSVCSADLSVRTCERKASGSLTSNATNNVEGEERKSIGKALVLETLLCALVMCIIRTFRLSFSFFASHLSWRTKLQTRGLLPSNQGLKWLKDDIYFGSFT